MGKKSRGKAMRKYRGLTIDTKQLVKGWYCEVEDRHYIIPDKAKTVEVDYSLVRGIIGFVEVDPETVGQETGSKDKHKKEIIGGFDNKGGDIVRYNYRLSEPDTDFFCEVIYDVLALKSGDGSSRHVGFILRGIEKNGESWFTDFPDIEDIEVIGNMTETPERLEGE